MKILFKILILASFLVILVNCSDDCEKKDPTVILKNDGTEKADIQIKTSGGNTENINNIQPGESSSPRSFTPGEIEFTVAIQGVQENVVYVLPSSYCHEYVVTINEDNTVSGTGRKLEKIIYP